MSKRMRANLLLLLAAIIWGVAFVAQDVASDKLPALTFNGARMAVAAVALWPVTRLMNRGKPKDTTPAGRKTLLMGGLCCGVMLALGSAFQQLGMNLGTGAGKAGFITAMYIVMVPLTGIFIGKRLGWMAWTAVVLATTGLYLLCMQGSFSLQLGDLMLILCAIAYTGHILVVDFFGRRTDCVKLSCLQCAVCAALCGLGALAFEQPTWEGVVACILPMLYAGVMSAGLGYTLQILGQKDAEPTVASLIMSLESVFAVLAGWVILGDALSARELAGCLMMMGGIVLSQLPQKKPC